MEEYPRRRKTEADLEIQALQAQINPHFIANTLNLIANIASVKNEQELSSSPIPLWI